MATEAGATEALLPTKGEAEAVCLTAAQLEKTVIETLAVELKLNELRETEEKQVESTTQVEITQNVVRSNNSSGSLEDASFLASLSGPAVSNEEASGPEDSRVDKLDPLETVIPENAKHSEKVQQAEVLDEIVYEVDQNGKTHDVLNTINEDSSEVAKSGEPKPEAEVDEAVKNETSLERNVEVILKDEEQGKMEESYTKPSSEEIPSIDEGALDRKIEACTDVQSVEETSSSKRATISEEYTEERSSEDIKEDKCVDVVTEEKVSEAILSKEDTETENEKDQITQDRVDDVSDSTISSSQESRSNETSDTKKDDPKRITTFIKDGDTQNLEESLKEKEEEEDTISVPQVKGNEVSTEEIVKIESTEAELPKNDSADLPAVRLLVEQAEILNGRNDDVSELKSHEDATTESNTEVLEELEIVGVSESTQGETKKDIESTAEESLQKQEEEDKSLNPIEASIEETKVVISEEVLRSRGEDDVHAQEITEGDVDKEHTIEREISSSLTESIQEETDKSYRDNKNEAEKSNEEESSGEILREGDVKELSPETAQEVAIETSKDHANEAETSKEKAIDESIPCEKDVERIVDASQVKQEVKSSVDNNKGEDESHGHNTEVDFDKEQTIAEATVSASEIVQEETSTNSRDTIKEEEKISEESTAEITKENSKNYHPTETIQEDVIEKPEDHEKKVESSKEKAVEENAEEIIKEESVSQLSEENTQEDAIEKFKDRENETEKCEDKVVPVLEAVEEGNCVPSETNKDVAGSVDNLLVKQEEDQQQVQYVEPIKDSVEEGKVEVLEEVVSNPRNRDDNHGQIADFDKEQTKEEVTVSTPEFQEENKKSPPDKTEAEDIKEESKIVSINEEAEGEKCKEVAQVFETPKTIESSPKEISKEAEHFVDASLEKQEEAKLQDRDEDSIENIAEDTASSEVVKDDESPDEVTETGIEVASKTEGNQQGEHENKEEKAEELHQETPEENEAQNLEESSETEKAENVDHTTDLEKEITEVETTEASESIQYKTSEGEEDSQQTTKEAESGEKLETLVLVTPKETETEPSSENAPSYSIEVEESAKNLVETSETGKEEKTTGKIDNTNDSEEVVQELKTTEADESISCDTSEDVESSTDPSSEKQEEVHHIDPAKVLIEEKKVEDTLSAELAKDDHDSKVEATGKTTEVEATGKEDERAMHTDEPSEKLEELPQAIPQETASESKETIENVEETLETGAKEEKTEEIHEVNDSEKEVVQELETDKDVESYVEPSSEKQEEDQCIEPADVLIEEKKVEGTLSTEVVKDNHDSNDGVAERTIEVADEGKELEEQTTQKDKPGEKLEDLVEVIPESENARTSTSEEVEETIEDVGKSSEKREEIQNLEAIEVLTKVEDDQDNKTEATESTTDVAKEGGKDEIQAIQKDEPGEKLEDLNQATLEEAETEQASENAGTRTCEEVAETIENLEKLSVKQEESQYLEPTEALTTKDDHDNNVEATERTIDVAEEGDKYENQVMQKDESGEKLEDLVQEKPEETETKPASENAGTSTCEEVEETVDNNEETSETAKKEKSDTNDPEKEVAQETTVISDDTSYDTNKEVESYGDHSSEKKEEDHSSERTIDIVAKDEEDEKQASEEDKPEEKLENLVQVTPEETETESTKENAGSSTCEEVEGTNQIEETSEAENKGQYTIDSEKEVTETSSGGQEITEVSREIDFTEESCQKGTDTETTEDTKEPQVITEPSSLLQEENVEEISKELVKEEGTESKEKEQSEVTDLVEETKPESLEENAKPNEDLHSAATTEAAEKENDLAKSDYDVVVEEKDLAADADVHAQSREVLAADLSGEICLKEAEPESEKQLESSDIAPEDKSLDSGVEDVELQSGDVSTEIVGEEAGLKEVKKVIEEQAGPGLKEVKPDVEEKHRSFEAVSEEKDFSSIVNIGLQSESVSTEIASGETSFKETEQEHEERVRSYDIASEDKGVASNVDVDVHFDSLSGEVVSEETCLKEDKPADEEHVKNLDIGSQSDTAPTGTSSEEAREQASEEQVRSYDAASEEKGLASSLDVDVTSDSISAMLSEETSLKEDGPSNEEQVKSNDIAPEEKGLPGEVKSDSVPTDTAGPEKCGHEAKQDDDQVKTSKVAPEEKSLLSSVDTDVQSNSLSSESVSEEAVLKEDKPADEEKIKSLDIGSQCETLPTGTLSDGVRLKEPDPDSEEHVRSYDTTSEEKGATSSLDVDTPSDSILTTIPSEEISLKEVELSNVEQIKSDDISREEKGLDGEVKFESVAAEAETFVPEAKKDDDQVKTSDVAPEEKRLPSSVETDVQYESVSTSLKEVRADTEQQADPQATELPSEETDVVKAKLDHEEQVGSPDIAPEDAILVRDVDIGIQSNSALHEVILKEDKPIYKEHVEFSDVEREAVESNVDGDEEPRETLKPEEDKENKALETAGEYEEKTRQETADESPIARPDSQQKEIAAETPLHDSSEENPKDNSSVPSTEQELETTKASDRSDETTAPDNSQCEDKKIPVIEPTKEEEELKQECDSKLESNDTDKQIVNEETRELNIHPEIIIRDAIPTEVHGGVEEAVESGGESIKSEFQPTPTGAERVIEEKYSSQKLTEVEETDSNEQTSESQVEEYAAEKIEESVPTVAKPKEENLHVDVSIATTEEGKIEEEIGREVENKGDNVDTTVGDEKAVTCFEEAQLIEEPVKPVDKPESITLEERSFDLVCEQPAEQEDRERDSILPEKCSGDEVEQVKLASNTECIADATSPIPAEQLQETDAIEEETKEASEDDEISKEQRQAPSSTLLPEKQDRETTTVETKEDLAEEVGYQDKENREPKLYEAAEERQGRHGTEEDSITAHEAVLESSYESSQGVSKDEVVADRDLPIGISTEPIQVSSSAEKAEEENTKENEILDDNRIKDSLATEVAEETKVKEEPEEDIDVVPVTVSNNADIIEVATEGENIEKSDSRSLPLKEQNDGTIVEQIVEDAKTEEATLGDEMRDCSETATTEETGVLKEEIKEVQDGEEIKDAVNTVSDTDSQSAQVATEERTIICETFAEKPSEVQLVEQSGEEEEKEKSKEVEIILGYENKETSSETTALTKEEPIEIKESASTLEVHTSEVSEIVSRETPETEVFSRDISAYQAIPTDNNEIKSLDKEEPKKVELSEPGIHASDQKEVVEVEATKADSPTQQDKAAETNEARDFVSDKVESPEPITSIEDVEIIEDHLKIATTDLRTLESQFEKKIEAQEATEKESCKEELSTEFGQEKSSLSIEEPEEILNTTCMEKTPLEAQTQVTTRGVEASTEETSPRDEKASKSELVSPSDLMQSSDHPTEGTEEKAKTDKREDDDEEEEDEDREESEHPDAPILVQSSKDVDAKASHKKSHGLFSGVGSKVKHSISKVKKAITGKSANS